ncbi:MAG: DUF1146 domain-containing protein [Erysipelotrichaceae bacterium]|jgi:uncharacterized membrane protein YwzB|nr:DUF1146 domain-containing protein [Erysipelotrichaceae bacterium]MCR5095354.1 DUF1146 domain-containing protein [Erysipelotrichaceae bacterium]
MFEFYIRVAVFFFSFLLSLYGLNALDFNRFIRQGKVMQGQVLYFILAASLSYLLGSFLMSMIYYFYKG